MATVLLVDDERSMRELLVSELEEHGWGALAAGDASEALAILAESPVDLVLTDLRMPGPSGTELCKEVVRLRPDVPVVVMSGFGSIDAAVEAIRAGAFDFVTKPFEFDALEIILHRALTHRRIADELRQLRRVCGNVAGFAGMVGTSSAMQRMFDLVDRFAESEASVLLVGESGTGKELAARALHERSARAAGPFVGFNCAAVPEQLLESELFGHAKGAFTDARHGRQGLLRQAEGGTLFLDEIGDMSLALQPKLLRALQERVVRPVGSDVEVPINVRIVAATHHDMRQAVARGTFRADLYYRLAVAVVHVPPLRERGDDILLLAAHFCESLVSPQQEPVTLSPQVEAALRRYDWPGNVRELRNVVERALALRRGNEIRLADLPPELAERAPPEGADPSAGTDGEVSDEQIAGFLPLGEVERRHILRVVEAVGGNKSRAAKILGIDRKTLYARLLRYGYEGADEG